MGCTHDCSSCSSDCKSKEQNLHEELNKYSSVKKVIGIFAHGGVLTCARVYAGEYDLKEAFKNVPSYGTVIRLELD